VDRRLSPRYFLKDEPLVARKVLLFNGTDLNPGDPIPDDLGVGNKLRLWTSGRAVYAKDYRPSPTQDDMAGDPIVDVAEVEAAAAALDAGPVHSVEMVHTGAGFYQLTPSWDVSKMQKVRGKAAAEARQAEMLADAPKPAGTQPEATEDAPEQTEQPETQPTAETQPETTSEAPADPPQE
jgi:hypothetical protein